MRELPLEELPLVGVLDLDRTADGIIPRRLPAWTRPQIVDPALALVVTMPAGARFALRTDATELELVAMLTAVQVGDLPFTPPTFDLMAGGELRRSATAGDCTKIVLDFRTGGIEYVPGEAATIRFDSLPGDMDVPLEVWLPHSAVVELRALRVTDGARVEPAPPATRRWIHYGSSISHCTETAHPTATWPAIAARRAGVDLMNLAVAGQCMLDQHVARTIRDLDANFISVKAGINVVNGDTMRERVYIAALHGFLDTVRDGHPTTPICVITPIVCPAAEDHPGPTVLGEDMKVAVAERPAALSLGALSLKRIRQVMAEVVDARRRAGDENLHLLSGLELFGEADLHLLPDGLHPNAEGYALMGERFHRLAFEGAGVFGGS